MDKLSAPMVDIARELENVWQETAEGWRDSTAAYFEQNYWWPLAETMLATIDAVRALEEELSAVRALAHDDF